MFFRTISKPILTTTTTTTTAVVQLGPSIPHTPRLTAFVTTTRPPARRLHTTAQFHLHNTRPALVQYHPPQHQSYPTAPQYRPATATTITPTHRQFSTTNSSKDNPNLHPDAPKQSEASPHRRANANAPRSGWLGRRIKNLRMWANFNTKESEAWDPWMSKPRDLEIGERNTNVIMEKAQAIRQKQLVQIEKFQKKAADKEASIRTPLAYAEKKRAERIPFSQRLKNVWGWVKEPKNYLGPWYKEYDLNELSMMQKCIYVYWRRTLIAIVAVLATLPQIPFVRAVINDLSQHRQRKRRGVLGLDEFCTPTKKYTKLKFYRTNDWSFDIQYLQKMSLRDLYVIKEVIDALKVNCDERLFYIEQSMAKLLALEAANTAKLPSGRSAPTTVLDMTPFQRRALLRLSDNHARLTDELDLVKKMKEELVDTWADHAQKAWINTDNQVTTFFNTYLISDTRQQRLLNGLIEHQKGIEEWRMGLEEEYDRHYLHLEEVERFCKNITEDEFKPFDPDGTIAIAIAEAEAIAAQAPPQVPLTKDGFPLDAPLTMDTEVTDLDRAVTNYLVENLHKGLSQEQMNRELDIVAAPYQKHLQTPPPPPVPKFVIPYPGINKGPVDEKGKPTQPIRKKLFKRPEEKEGDDQVQANQKSVKKNDTYTPDQIQAMVEHLDSEKIIVENNRQQLKRHQQQIQMQAQAQAEAKRAAAVAAASTPQPTPKPTTTTPASTPPTPRPTPTPAPKPTPTPTPPAAPRSFPQIQLVQQTGNNSAPSYTSQMSQLDQLDNLESNRLKPPS